MVRNVFPEAMQQRALTVAESIVQQILEQIEKREEASSVSPRRPDPSIASGSSGRAVVLQYALEALAGNSSWENAIHFCLRDAVEAAGTNPTGIELFKGLTGIAFAATATSCGGARYGKLLSSLVDRISSQSALLAARIRSANGLATADFDVISGLSGVVAFLLYARDRKLATLTPALEALVCLAGETGSLPRIHTPARLIVNSTMADTYQAGYVNIGLAHGLPGPLAALSLALIQGVEVPGQRDAIRWYADYLAAHQLADSRNPQWPSAVSLDPNSGPMPPARLAWCYGAPGILRALYLAGVALGDRSCCEFASAALYRAIRNCPFGVNFPDPLCHGLAGILAIVLRFCSEDTGSDWQSLRQDLLSKLTLNFQPAFPYGYASLAHDGTRQYQPALLDGAGGIALVLLSASTAAPAWWDRLLLIA